VIPRPVLCFFAVSRFVWLAAPGCASATFAEGAPAPGFQRGVALGFISPDAKALAGTLDETARLGASDVSILVPLYTEGIAGRSVRWGALDDARGGDGTTRPPGPASEVVSAAPDAAALLGVLRAAAARGQRVMVFPIVRLRARGPGEWRGKLRPADRDAWFAEYARTIEAIADVCRDGGAARLVIGSELVSFEDEPERWRALARSVRTRFAGRLLYSANWDRWDEISFWDAVDEIGISAYFTLAERGSDPQIDEIVARWRPITSALSAFAKKAGRPIVFTEVGYPSVRGAAFWPWNDHQSKTECAAGEGCDGELSLESQRRLWAAFVRVFAAEQTSFLAGAYVWLWSGRGGLADRGYTPRGKPAEAVIKLWYAGGRPRPEPLWH
jgi:hypothetical protein